MQYIEKHNDFILLSAFVFIVILAEITSTLALFLFTKGFLILGIFFYILKIIIYIPSIDIFRRNKERLLKYKIIKLGVFLYEKIENNPFFIEIKNRIKNIKIMLLFSFKKFKDKFIKFWSNLWKV